MARRIPPTVSPRLQKCPAPSHWDGLAEAIAADRAVLGPAAARLLVWALDVVDREARRTSTRVSNAPHLAEIRQVLEYVASGGRHASQAGGGHGDVPIAAGVPTSGLMKDPITAPQAGKLLGVTRRHAARLARDGAFQSTRKLAAGYLIERAEVLAYAQHRTQEAAR